MRIKTIIVVLLTILITVVLMQNTDRVNFIFLWMTIPMPKLVMLTAVSVLGFVLGVLVGRPSKVRNWENNISQDGTNKNNSGTLSEEDKDYIS